MNTLIKLPLLVSHNTSARIAIYPCVIFTDAAKKHHEYLVRLEKTLLEEVKLAQSKSSRNMQRRQRVCMLIINTSKVPYYITLYLFSYLKGE